MFLGDEQLNFFRRLQKYRYFRQITQKLNKLNTRHYSRITQSKSKSRATDRRSERLRFIICSKVWCVDTIKGSIDKFNIKIDYQIPLLSVKGIVCVFN